MDPHDNDGAKLFQAIRKDLFETLRTIEGPYAFIYIRGDSVFWARDPLGRRSLLIRQPDETCNELLITSTAPSSATKNLSGWQEVPTNGMFELNLTSGKIAVSLSDIHLDPV